MATKSSSITLHPDDARTIKSTLDDMVIEYLATNHDLLPEHRQRIHLMTIQVNDLIEAATIKTK